MVGYRYFVDDFILDAHQIHLCMQAWLISRRLQLQPKYVLVELGFLSRLSQICKYVNLLC